MFGGGEGRSKSTLGVGVGAYLRLGAYQLFLPSGWAIIRGWALNLINTVVVTMTVSMALMMMMLVVILLILNDNDIDIELNWEAFASLFV